MRKFRALWLLMCLVGSGLSPLTAANALDQNKAYTINVLPGCPGYAFNPKEFVLFDGRTNLLEGWSHIDKTPIFGQLKNPSNDYLIDASHWVNQPGCDQEKVFSTVLVKKIGNWSGSHVNGIEPIIEHAALDFGDVEAVVLEFKINETKTFLPSKVDVAKQFSFAGTVSELEALDNQLVSFGITLFEPGFGDQNSPSLNAQTLVSIDQRYLDDKWLKVVIPVGQMRVYLEQNYAATDVQLADYINHSIMGLRINPETTSAKVARHLKPKAWEQAERPELFKEMGVEFRKVALLLK